MHQSGLISAITDADLDATMAPLGFAPATPPPPTHLLLRVLHLQSWEEPDYPLLLVSLCR
jgi:hypothetical protein